MTALHSDLGAELGLDHYFHVVPRVGEYSFSSLRVVSLHVVVLLCACRSGLVAPATVIAPLWLIPPLGLVRQCFSSALPLVLLTSLLLTFAGCPCPRHGPRCPASS